MGRIFSSILSFCLPWRWSCPASIVSVWGRSPTLRSLAIRWWPSGRVVTRPASSSGGGSARLANSSWPLGGPSGAPTATRSPRARTIRLMRGSSWSARAPSGNWLTRWRERQRRRLAYQRWLINVAQQMYAEEPTVQLRIPRAVRAALRQRRLRSVRGTDRPACTSDREGLG